MNWNILISELLQNFGLSMFALATLLMLLHKITFGLKLSMFEIIYRWFALLALGVTALYAFIMHAFYPDLSAAMIGWQNSPFQYEVAMANLAIGVLGVLSFKASYGFRLATVIAAMCWLWGDAVGHIYQMIVHHNFAPGNAGSWFWLDLAVPLILLVCIINLRPRRYP